MSSAALKTSPHSDWQTRSRAVQPALDPQRSPHRFGEEAPSVATSGTRAVRVDTRAMCCFCLWELAARRRSFGTRSSRRSGRQQIGPRGLVWRWPASTPKAGVVANGWGRKVLFGGVGVRPKSRCRGRRYVRGDPARCRGFFASGESPSGFELAAVGHTALSTDPGNRFGRGEVDVSPRWRVAVGSCVLRGAVSLSSVQADLACRR